MVGDLTWRGGCAVKPSLTQATVRLVVCMGPACRAHGAFGVERALLAEMTGAAVIRSGCLQVCARAPNVVAYPRGCWYGRLNRKRAAILGAALEMGQAPDLPPDCFTAHLSPEGQ